MSLFATARTSIGFCLAAVALGALQPASAQSSAQPSCAGAPQQLIIYHAGSLSAAFTAVEKLFTQQTGACVTDVAAGSLDAARRVTAGGEPADIFAAADYLDIDLLLKPARFAGYDILFAQGSMVLGYTTASRGAATIAANNVPFDPPNSVPDAAANWYDQLTKNGILIGDSNPFLDPTGYRVDLIFQLAAASYGVPNLYDSLLEHYTLARPTDVVGTSYDYQFLYESSALASYRANPATYRYVRLPPEVNLSSPGQESRYNRVSIVVPGLGFPDTASKVRIPATQLAWGITVLRTAPHPATAVRFLQLLFSQQGVALQADSGPTPISPPLVSAEDYERLPPDLKPLVRAQR